MAAAEHDATTTCACLKAFMSMQNDGRSALFLPCMTGCGRVMQKPSTSCFTVAGDLRISLSRTIAPLPTPAAAKAPHKMSAAKAVGAQARTGGRMLPNSSTWPFVCGCARVFRICRMSSVRVSVLPVPAGPKRIYGCGRPRPDSTDVTAAHCSSLMAGLTRSGAARCSEALSLPLAKACRNERESEPLLVSTDAAAGSVGDDGHCRVPLLKVISASSDAAGGISTRWLSAARSRAMPILRSSTRSNDSRTCTAGKRSGWRLLCWGSSSHQLSGGRIATLVESVASTRHANSRGKFDG
mmetsp:Transcript_47048/g.120012  ORF Transcript_47048/g.120012 Transcript_47048/m.120012 type:complete len:297 (-) Transcript_47048:733-1623(-)